ncbi:uncharacterized protein TNCV_3247841 [Trichonephila clavipes]|nr:uncharacterized protein TNCV_3247841 [Trichonephila clavipes]
MQLGSTSAIRCLERGCPQGSESGPFFFWNIINHLFKLNNLACCETIAFADDILVCSQGSDLSATFLHAQEALNLAFDWSNGFIFDFNPDKTTEKRNVCYDAFQLYLDGTPLTMVKQMKHLGVLLNTKFSWKQHLSYISQKCDTLQRGLNRIARNTFGINFNVHSLIYKQGIEPFILYGSRVWGEALKRKMNSKYMQCIQRRIRFQVICGYRTISYDSVYAISGLLFFIILLLGKISLLHPSLIMIVFCLHFFSLILHRGMPSILFNLVTRAQMISLLFAILMTVKLMEKLVSHLLCSGLVLNPRTLNLNRIRDECTVFIAELLCLNFAVKWITEQNSVISEYLICTDSLSSLDSLRCISSSNNITVVIQKQLKSLKDKNISIDFAFVRGHTRVLWNEQADWLAKVATKRKIDIDVNIPKLFYKKITKERMVNSWKTKNISFLIKEA